MKFLKQDRILKRHDFKRLSRTGKRVVGRFLSVDFCVSSRSRLGISASTQYGSSPERNRFKRLVREAFRRSLLELPLGLEMNVMPRKWAKEAKLVDIQEDLLRLFHEPISKTSR